jgi:hypothetical protein
MHHDEVEWTPEEREALDRLPREQDPGDLVEERTVAALKERGLLRQPDVATAGPVRSEPRARRPGRSTALAARLHPAWWATGIAAALALFFGGIAFGQARSDAAAVDLVRAIQSADAEDRPSLIQQTGSLYVGAIAGLAATASATEHRETLGTGVEVGLTALYAAAYELARLHPEDPRLRRVLEALESDPEGDPETDVHWF